MFEIIVSNGTKFFQIVFDVQGAFVNGGLAHNRIKIEPALRHSGAGGNRLVTVRVHQDVSVLVRFGVKVPGNQHRRAFESRPGFPALVLETELRGWFCEPRHVDSERLHQIGLDFPQHLTRLHDFDGRSRLVEMERLAKFVNRVNMHSGHCARTQIKGNTVRFLVLNHHLNAFS